MPYSTVPTLLPLSTYARLLGLGPIHFAQGVSTLRPERDCSTVWFQYDWQDADKVSRSQLSELIAEAERDVATALGYWPAPKWIEDERILYPRPHQNELIQLDGTDIRGFFKSVQAKWGMVIQGGFRNTASLGEASYTTIDADGDGFAEWAEFTIAGVSATLDVCEVHAYFKEYALADAANTRTDPSSTGADEDWEVRPINVSLSGTTLTILINTWELFRPQLYEEFNAAVIDADALASYVDELVFYRVYTDASQMVTFGWGEASCTTPACATTTQDGCIRVKNRRSGIVIPQPGTYSADTGEYTLAVCWTGNRDPDMLWLDYYAGLVPERIVGCNLLDRFWAMTIARLATARLDWKLCTCANVAKTVEYLREDLSLVNDTRSFQVDPDIFSNPFGTRYGELWAWRRVKGRGQAKGIAIKV